MQRAMFRNRAPSGVRWSSRAAGRQITRVTSANRPSAKKPIRCAAWTRPPTAFVTRSPQLALSPAPARLDRGQAEAALHLVRARRRVPGPVIVEVAEDLTYFGKH